MAINIRNNIFRWFAIGLCLLILTAIIQFIPGALALSLQNQIVYYLYMAFSLIVAGYVIENWLGKVISVKMKR